MISAKKTIGGDGVAGFYDTMHELRIDALGDHIHHGIWRTGSESQEEAGLELVRTVARYGAIANGCRVCDVGSGYGGTARILVSEYGASVTGFTISERQFEVAQRCNAGALGNPVFFLRDWLDNGCADESFDTVIALESSEHFVDKKKFFSEAYRVLRPGGHLVVSSWLAPEHVSPFRRTVFLEPICRDNQFPSLGSAREYEALYRESGFDVLHVEDVSHAVRGTWSQGLLEGGRSLLRDPEKRRSLARNKRAGWVMTSNAMRLWTAYTVGALCYGIFAGQRRS